MSDDRSSTAFVAALLVAVGALAWHLTLRTPLRADATPLAAIPVQLAGWQGTDLPLESGAESMLRADHNLQRAYTDPSGNLLWAYVGYYGTTRGGRPEHTPAACYEAHGWAILARQVLAVPGAPDLRLTEYLVEQGATRQLVQFWFRSYRRTGMLDGWDQTLDHVVGRFETGRADGALVRVSARLGDDGADAARARLLAFAATLDAELAAHWPTETPVADAR
jgi:EpsI family protein